MWARRDIRGDLVVLDVILLWEGGDEVYIPVPQIPTKAGLILICPSLHTGSGISSTLISSIP
jgi:hypothetical protein